MKRVDENVCFPFSPREKVPGRADEGTTGARQPNLTTRFITALRRHPHPNLSPERRGALEGLETLRLATLLAALAFTGAALAQSGGDYRLIRHVTAAGGGTSPGGANYRLHGTIGQADAGTSTLQGGGFRLRGGYWASATEGDGPGPEPGEDPIFSDGFENTGGNP